MPFKSLAQERWGHTPEGQKALGGAAKVAEWDSATKGAKLPKRVNPKAQQLHAAGMISNKVMSKFNG